MAASYNHLTDVLAAVNANLVTNGTFTTTQINIGSLFKPQEDAWPRLVWVPSSDSYSGAVDNKGLRVGAGRALRTRSAGVEANLWGGTIAGTEDLITGLIQAIQMGVTASNAAYELNGGEWRKDGYEAYGFVYVLKVAFQIPIQDVASTLATITSLPQTNTMRFLDGTTVNT